MGKPYDRKDTSLLFIRCNAYARALTAVWSAYFRILNQIDPHTMTDFLPSWESVFGITPAFNVSLEARRAQLALRMQYLKSGGSIALFIKLLRTILPNTFDHVELIPSTLANTHVPLGATVPGGINVPADGQWSSTISHILVIVKKPVTMTENEFYTEVGQLYNYASLMLPAWATFDWARDGAMGLGFYLDDEHNLDNERFD
jgi:hypothetical protein